MKSLFKITVLYFCVAIGLLFPIVKDWQDNLIGVLGTDTLDTLGLQYGVTHQISRFFPIGFDFTQLTPNILDHIFFALVQWLPFPFSYNFVILVILTLNAVAGHILGQNLTQEHSNITGYWMGLNILAVEALWRDITWGHIPQTMLFAPILSLAFCLKSKQNTKDATSIYLAGIFYAIAGFSYLFWLPMLSAMLLMILTTNWKNLLKIHLVGLILLLPNFYWLFVHTTSMVDNPLHSNPVQQQQLFEAHSNNWLWWWNNSPVDTSNRISIVLVGMVVWRFLRPFLLKKRPSFTQLDWVAMGIFLLGMVMLLGANSPFSFLYTLPPFSRLMWPERWGWITGLALSILTIFTTKPRYLLWWIPVVFMELYLRSSNFPLVYTSLEPLQCYRQLEQLNGAILELPLERADPLYNRMSLTQRLHQRPLVNPFVLPPQHRPSSAWESFKIQDWLQHLDGKGPIQNEDIQSAMEIGISAIIVDRSNLSQPRQHQAIVQHLRPLLGEPIDLGCALLWSFTSLDQHAWTKYPSEQFPKFDIQSHQEPIHVW